MTRFIHFFGFKYRVELSTMPEDHMGDEADWEHAQKPSRMPLRKWAWSTNKRGRWGIYGPKIDFHLEDSLGKLAVRNNPAGFPKPERFELGI